MAYRSPRITAQHAARESGASLTASVAAEALYPVSNLYDGMNSRPYVASASGAVDLILDRGASGPYSLLKLCFVPRGHNLWTGTGSPINWSHSDTFGSGYATLDSIDPDVLDEGEPIALEHATGSTKRYQKLEIPNIGIVVSLGELIFALPVDVPLGPDPRWRRGKVAAEAPFSLTGGGTAAWRLGPPLPLYQLSWIAQDGTSLAAHEALLDAIEWGQGTPFAIEPPDDSDPWLWVSLSRPPDQPTQDHPEPRRRKPNLHLPVRLPRAAVMLALPAAYGRVDAQVVNLVRLIAYSDHTAKTIQAVLTFGPGGFTVRYPWGGVEQVFEPVVQNLAPVTTQAEQLAAQISRATSRAPLKSSWSVTLANVSDYAGSGISLLDTILGLNLDFAGIEFASLAIDGSEWMDLTGYAGTEHHVWFRGVVSQHGTRGKGATIELTAEREIPRIPWLRALNPTDTATEDVGTIYPLVAGMAKRVRCVKRIAGVETTLAETLTKGATGTVKLTTTRGLSLSGTTVLRINGEELTVDSVDSDADTVNIVSRGESGTQDVEHKIGESVIEMPDETVLVVEGHPGAALSALYLRNPYDGKLFKLDATTFTFSLDDDSLEPGRNLTTVTISQEQLRGVLVAMQVQSIVTVQPVFIDASAPTPGSTSTVNPSSTAKPVQKPVGHLRPRDGYPHECHPVRSGVW